MRRLYVSIQLGSQGHEPLLWSFSREPPGEIEMDDFNMELKMRVSDSEEQDGGRALVMSLGGSPEPLAVSIANHKPEWVFFLASQGSVVKLAEVLQKTAEQGTEFRHELELVDDPADLVECYEKALALMDRALAKGFAGREIVVDYTGGTKTMTAAMALAAAGRGFKFAYVSGAERSKGGLGVVLSGTEEVRRTLSPWQLFAVEERKRLKMLFDTHQYAAAEKITEELQRRAGAVEHPFYTAAVHAARAYGAWDLFDHRNALEGLKKAARSVENLPPVSAPRQEGVQTFRRALEEHLHVLSGLVPAKGESGHPTRALLYDLIANADRRFDEGKADDAVARLYRALEMTAQIAFWEAHRVETGKMPLDFLPEGLRQKYSTYLDEESTTLKLPLFAAYSLLADLQHPLGQRFVREEQRLRGVLNRRNQSILAHGLTPVKQDVYGKLRAVVCDFAGVRDEELVVFPKLTLW